MIITIALINTTNSSDTANIINNVHNNTNANTNTNASSSTTRGPVAGNQRAH